MAVIDADTHVDESDDTWLKMEGPLARYQPVTVAPRPGEAPRPGFNPQQSRWWLFEGTLMARAVRDEEHHPPRVRRELEDVPGRLRHMDEMGVDMQVIFPTFFIRHGTTDPEAEWALASTYNRWVQKKCDDTGGRLRWTCVLPYLQPDKAVQELRWAKEHGACGIFKRGFDLEKAISDPYFFPIYEEANALDMPLCIHTGHPLPGRPGNRAFPIISSFLGIVSSGVAEKLPRLRFALVEAGASWIPYTLSQKAAEKRQQMRDQGKVLNLMELIDLNRDLFRTNRVYVTVDPVDDVEYLVRLGLEDSLMIGTDYSHHDISANLNAFDEVRSWADEGRISQTAVQKMIETNPATCYGL